jgi:acyl-CoA hydrolase
MSKNITASIRLRLGHHDAHYAGDLVDGAKMLQLFGDLATEILIRLDGDEGLFRAYEMIEFLSPVMAGDYIEANAKLIEIGKSSRKIEFEAYKVISSLHPGQEGYLAASSAQVLASPILVCRARGTCVTPLTLQRLQTKR